MGRSMLSALVIALSSVTCEGTVESCASSPDGCRASSLMQLDVQGSSRALFASNEDAGRSRTLAGFQKFAENLAMRAIQDPPKPNHTTGLNESTMAAVDMIIEFVDNMFTHLESEHTMEKNLAHMECIKSFETCEYHRENISNGTRSSNASALKALEDHGECRGQGVVYDKCKIYDDHRKDPSNKFPQCAQDGDMDDEKVQVDETVPSNKPILETMETCLVKVYHWMQAIYPLYLDCLAERAHNDGIEDECNGKQSDFERKVCAYVNDHNTECHYYKECWTNAGQSCDVTCSMIEASVEARKADNETAGRVKCLLLVLKANNTDKKDMLDACKAKTYNTDYWNIACSRKYNETEPPHPEPPCPGDNNTPELKVPCDGFPFFFEGGAPDSAGDLKEYAYEHEDWFDHWPDIQCREQCTLDPTP